MTKIQIRDLTDRICRGLGEAVEEAGDGDTLPNVWLMRRVIDVVIASELAVLGLEVEE